MMEHNIESELKLTPGTNELQAKMTKVEGKPEDQVLAQIRDAFSLADFDLQLAEPEHIQDEYYDTADLILHASHAVIRVRHSGNKVKITAKKLRSHELGLVERLEFDRTVAASAPQSNVRLQVAAFAAEVFTDLPRDAALIPVVKIINRRQNFLLARGGASFVMSIDKYRFESIENGTISDEKWEVEIEATNDTARLQLPALKTRLTGALGLRYSEGSKYERAVEFIKSRGVKAASPPEVPPTSFTAAVMTEVYRLPPKRRRRIIIVVSIVAVVAVVVFAIWKSLPDAVKERWLGNETTNTTTAK